MTNDEREMLRQASEDAAMLRQALFEVPPGSPDDERPLIEGLRVMWRSYQRGSWLARMLMWLVPAMAAFGAAISQMKGWVPWSGK